MARDAAKAEIAAGNDPNDNKQELKRVREELRAETFEKHAKTFTAKAVKEGKADATLAKTEWLLGMAIADFGKKPMAEITSPMVLQCLRKVEANRKHLCRDRGGGARNLQG